MYKVGLYTLGCKVSLYETEAIAEAFVREGYETVPFESFADVYVINTCTVTAESDAKSRKYIRRAIRQNPDAVVMVVGCYSQRSPEAVAAIPGVSAVVGTADKLSVVKRAGELLSQKKKAPLVSVGSLDGAVFEPMRITSAVRTRGYVKIEDGCECRCSYCAISSARGPVRSKPREDVISEVEGLYKNGTREIVLTGIETGSYGADFKEKYDLADLICELDARSSCERIRLGSMAPELIGEKFISRISTTSIMVPHFHVSMQSGSDAVLRAMRRRYNSRTALENIERIRAMMPGVMFTADLMVGFPGETEENFLETVEFVKRARLLDAHVFAYSRREGTPAADFSDQIPEPVKHERSARLIEIKNAVRDEVLTEVVKSGKPLPTILETYDGSYYTGHTDSYIEARTAGDRDLRGELVSLTPRSHENGIIYGEIAEI